MNNTHHFDQYCSKDYQSLILRYRLLCCMSARGNCYDNAIHESCFHILNVDHIDGERFPTRALMRQTVFEHIEVDYNRTRRHGARPPQPRSV